MIVGRGMQMGGWAVVALAALLAGCGGGGGGGSAAGPAVSGAAVKGPLDGATVCAFQITNGTKGVALPVTSTSGSVVGGCYVTGADGAYNFSLPAGTTGDVMVESSGGRFCSNETPVSGGACAGGGTLVTLAGSDALRAVVAVQAGAAASVYLTPLSTAAVGAAGATLTSTTFATQFGTLAGALGVNPANVTPATAPTATNHPYLPTQAQQIAGGSSLGSVVQAIQQHGGGNGGGTTTPATVNAALVGTFTLKFYAGGGDGCGSSCSYTEGQEVPVTVHADGRLSLPGKTLSNPFYRSYGGSPHLPEVIWLDADAKVEYALSDNEQGSFNEINVGDASQPQQPFGTPRFLGQIRTPVQTGAEAIAPLVGTYALGSQYYGATVAWTAVTIAADGAITFTGTGPNVTTAQVVAITDRKGCCNRVDVELNFDLNNSGSVTADDRIEIFTDAGGAVQDIEYSLTPHASQKIGVRLGAQAALPTHSGVDRPAGNAVAALIGDTTVSVNSDSSSVSGTLNAFSLIAMEENQSQVLQKSFVLQFSSASALQQGQTLECRSGVQSGDNQITYQPSANAIYRSDAGGRCTMTITQLVVTGGQITEIGGTFVAELGDFKHQRTVVKDGVFHWLKPVVALP